MRRSISVHIYTYINEFLVISDVLTPSLPQPVKFSGSKMLTYTPADSIFDGPATTLLSIQCILIEVLSRAHAKEVGGVGGGGG